ncbi:YraN family protein [Patescibacteria group bacterium]|nr:MAG: YraN family protein [Patescibacteria group bacterium]
MAKHNEVGRVGEDVAREFLIGKGFIFVSANYRKPYGEIDLIFKDISNKLIFIEVKTVSWETPDPHSSSVSHETHRPEENIHPQKIQRLKRVIQTYLVSHEMVGDWQFDVIAVFLDQKNKTAKVRHLKNIILES